MEEWRTIVEFPTYEVSNTGKVRNAKTGRVLKPVTSAGYPMCNLYKNRKAFTKKIHRLVMETFLPVEDKTLVVNHKDGNKTNNTLSNLEWVTSKTNTKHAFDSGLQLKGEKHGNALLTEADVTFIRSNYKFRCPNYGCVALAKRFGVSNSTISAIVNNKRWVQK